MLMTNLAHLKAVHHKFIHHKKEEEEEEEEGIATLKNVRGR